MLECGRIVWSPFIDTRNVWTHPHPAVIITPTEEIAAGLPITVAVASTQLDLTDPAEQIELPSLNIRGGHPVTKLTQRCAVVCTWIRPLDPTKIERYAGKVYGRLLQEILERVRQLNQPPT
jgi:mRNA-degrading endonuclease toxin of MazEF toxin-antitoxin module